MPRKEGALSRLRVNDQMAPCCSRVNFQDSKTPVCSNDPRGRTQKKTEKNNSRRVALLAALPQARVTRLFSRGFSSKRELACSLWPHGSIYIFASNLTCNSFKWLGFKCAFAFCTVKINAYLNNFFSFRKGFCLFTLIEKLAM